MIQKFHLPMTVLLLVLGCQPVQPEKPDAETDATRFEKAYIDTHNGYSEAVVVTTGSFSTIYVSGQVGEGETLDGQMRSALANLQSVLGKAGATMGDVVKMNTYIVDYGPETLEVFRGVRREMLGEVDMPASTLVGVESLALPGWLIEIEAVAVIPVPQ